MSIADGMAFPHVNRTDCIVDNRIPSSQGEVLGADATWPSIASRDGSIELGIFLLHSKRDLFSFRRTESTLFRVGGGHQTKPMADATAA